jgi:hypothetical protein
MFGMSKLLGIFRVLDDLTGDLTEAACILIS